MPRRSPYAKVVKINQIREDHVRGMGDVVFKGFQCLNSVCQESIYIRKDEIDEDFEITCPRCGMVLTGGGESRFYDYTLLDVRYDTIIEEGEFTVFHDEYLAEAQEYKYCIICNAMKPLSLFDAHRGRRSGRQGECRLCKKTYNAIKNKTRLTDQHREAAQKRRLYLDLSSGPTINSAEVYKRFTHKCFKCEKDLLRVTSEAERPLDHTLPVVYLWPMTTENATLLCREHNMEKAGKWPPDYYSTDELKRLSVLTGIDLSILAGPPQYNPDAIALLKTPQYVDELLTKYSAYMPEIIKLRNRILADEGFDFFQYSSTISPAWVQKADEEYQPPPD